MGPRAIEITPEIWQVGGPALTAPEDAAIYLVELGGRAALIDAGSGAATDLLLANVESTGVSAEQIDYLLLTHCHFDHTGGASALRRRFGWTVVAHALDAPYIERGDNEVTAADWYGAVLTPCPVDVRLCDARTDIVLGDRVITAIHIPGHSPGSVAYLVESAGARVVFAQDVHGPLHPSLRSDRRDYLASLQTLLDLDADILCEGHFGIFRGKRDITRFVRQYMA